jgi:hypothetical protein
VGAAVLPTLESLEWKHVLFVALTETYKYLAAYKEPLYNMDRQNTIRLRRLSVMLRELSS